AIAAARQHDALTHLGQIGDDSFFVDIQNLGANGHAQDDVLAVSAGALAAHAAAPVLGKEMLLIAEVDQRVEAFNGHGHDIAAPAAVPAIGPAVFDEFLAAEGNAAVASGARADGDTAEI